MCSSRISCGPSGIRIMKSTMCVNCTAASNINSERSDNCFMGRSMETARDDQCVAGQPSRVRGREEHSRGGDVLGLADAAQRRLRFDLFLQDRKSTRLN